jgi:hypothetical protein
MKGNQSKPKVFYMAGGYNLTEVYIPNQLALSKWKDSDG